MTAQVASALQTEVYLATDRRRIRHRVFFAPVGNSGSDPPLGSVTHNRPTSATAAAEHSATVWPGGGEDLMKRPAEVRHFAIASKDSTADAAPDHSRTAAVSSRHAD
jgi:hypothetical protein